MTGTTAAHSFVRWALLMTACIAGLDGVDTSHLVEDRFQTPEASSRKCRNLFAHGSPAVCSVVNHASWRRLVLIYHMKRNSGEQRPRAGIENGAGVVPSNR